MAVPIPLNETDRLAALKRYEILDTPPEQVFDIITRLVSAQLDVPIALVSLVDETRQWFKSRYGLGAHETPREIAFCAHAILGTEVFIVEDATKDARFDSNPLVTGPPGIRFYAGAPLRTKDGYQLGTLNAIDVKPRTLTDSQLHLLKELARVVVDVIDLRQAAKSVVDDERNAARTAERMSGERAQELRASEERFQDISSNVPGVVYQFKIDARGRPSFPYVSETIKGILGLDPSDVVRDPDTWFDVILANDRAGFDKSVAESQRTLGPWLWEGRMVRTSGEIGWFRGSSTPRKLDDGSVLWNGLVFDITERMQAEERLRQAQKMEAVGQLTGGVAHDFNNLLAVILGNAELLADQQDIENEPLNAIFRAANRGGELTKRLLAFSRQQPLRARPVELADLVAGMSELLGRTLGETIQVETKVQASLWSASADPGQVENALLNLAINARDAMRNGGKLTIECANARLDEAYKAEHPEAVAGDYVVLTVRDTGTGMSDEVRVRAFEPFFTTKEVGQGSGLGLSMVYGFAKQSGGHVAICSEGGGKGTTVRLYLPRGERAEAHENTNQKRETPLGRGETVLVVEDDPDVREVAGRILEELDYRVTLVADAAAADEALSTGGAVDLLLFDVVLPGGTSGPEFAEKARARYPDLRVVFMSGYPTQAASRADLLGCDTVLINKPFRRQELAMALRNALVWCSSTVGIVTAHGWSGNNGTPTATAASHRKAEARPGVMQLASA